MHLHVYFTPAELHAVAASPEDIYIVVDMMRATTSLPVMFERRAARVFVAGSVEVARAARVKHPNRLLCGERALLPLPGFDYGNSPVQFSQVDLAGRELIMTTTNGTRAFYACPEHSIRLAGSFYNAHAVTTHAVALTPEQHSGIALVCSGESDYFALDDAVCAGYLAQQIIQYAQADILEIDESVEAATALYETYQPPKIMDHCNSAHDLIKGGQIKDVYFCMQVSQSTSIPIVAGTEEDTGLLYLSNTSVL
jgi:2-phosphosulfolactate phosphatase